MIPYFEGAGASFRATGGPFAFFVGLGFVVAVGWNLMAAQRRGESVLNALAASLMAIGAGLLGAHLLAASESGRKSFAAVFDGLSSAGGFAGAALGLLLLARVSRRPLAGVFDAACRGLPLGFACGRIGCFLVHDHPGIRSDLPLAVAYPGGGRFDLGLIEALVFLALAPVARRGAAPFLAAYAAARFFLDFLRIDAAGAADLARFLPGVREETRVSGLTPAQWLALAYLAGFVIHWIWTKASPRFQRT